MHADVERYLERIAYRGRPSSRYDTLAGIVAAHTAAVPFENLDVLLGRPVRLDAEGLHDKLVRRRRGGYCFEQATLMAGVLDALGFVVERHAARVIMYAPRTAVPRTHMFLVVRLAEGAFVVDPGFGRLAARVPVPLDGSEVASEDTRHRMVRDGERWTLNAKVDGESIDAWTTTFEEQYPIDFEMANHYTATHPASPFVNRLTLRAYSGDTRVTVMNREVTFAGRDGTVTTELADRRALRALIAEHFGFDLPEVEMLRVPTVREWAA